MIDWREGTFIGVDGSVWRLGMDVENEGVMLTDDGTRHVE